MPTNNPRGCETFEGTGERGFSIEPSYSSQPKDKEKIHLHFYNRHDGAHFSLSIEEAETIAKGLLKVTNWLKDQKFVGVMENENTKSKN